MTAGTILFVHGTGVRLKDYKRGLAIAEERARAAGIKAAFVECAWGDPLGVVFKGMSLPDPPSEAELRAEEQDFARWSWLIDDPLFELERLTTPDPRQPAAPPSPSRKSPAKVLWDKIAAYQPSTELTLLLRRAGLEPFWKDAWTTVIKADVAKLAFERSAHELPEASNALARAVVAQLIGTAWDQDHPGTDRHTRDALVQRLLNDWGQIVYGLSDFFARLFKRAATRVLRRHRNDLTGAVAFALGDILLYQSRGAEVRKFIREKITEAKQPPVLVVAHSLGGIASFDLLALSDPPPVAGLVTVGSQAAFLYELGALTSLKPPQPLPAGFPRWLNVYDRNDFLSYTAKRLFPSVEEKEVTSARPFPESHSAYFANDAVWQAIQTFAGK
jgi:hypothetical protein